MQTEDTPWSGAPGGGLWLPLAGGAGVLEGLALFDAERANVEAGQAWAVGNAVGREDAAGGTVKLAAGRLAGVGQGG
jgi:hypothetical protein